MDVGDPPLESFSATLSGHAERSDARALEL